MWRRMHARASVCVYVCVWAQAGNGESLITEHLSQTQIVTNLPRLQNTTFQTGSQSKYSPLIPRLIFKASLFSLSLFLSPHTTNTRTSSNRKRERGERKEENLNLAFREWLGWCLEIFHILFTPDRFQPGTAEGWQGPRPGHKSPVSLSLSLFASGLHRLKDLNLQTVPHRLRAIIGIKPKANKHTSRSRHPGRRFTPGGQNCDPDRINSFHATKMWLQQQRL